MTILVVDDDPVSVRVVQLTLQRQRFHVVSASSAADALEWLSQRNAVEMVITDHNMAGMSGLELFAALSEDLRWRHVPVILCTGAADRATVDQAIKVGVRHFMVKPIKPALLVDKVNRVLGERKPAVESKYEAMARLGLSDQEYRTVAQATIDHLATLGRQLVTAEQSRDSEEVAGVVRRIREPAALLGAARCIAAVEEFERFRAGPREGQAIALVAQEVAAVEEALEAVLRRPLLETD